MSDTVISNELELSKEALQNELTSLRETYRECRAKLEAQNQETYNQSRELNRLKCLEAEYLQEIEVLASAEKSLASKYEAKVKNLEDKISQLQHQHLEQLDQHKLELQKRDCEIEELQNFVKTVQDGSDTDTKVIDDLNSENTSLKDHVIKLSDRIEELTTINNDLEKQHAIAEDTVNDLRKENAELHKSYMCKEEELHEARCAVLNLQEEAVLAKSELELLKTKPSDCKTQGNSLFAEVNDRRLQLQQTITEMKAGYKKLQREKGIHLQQISKLQLQVATLCQRWDNELKEKENDEEREEHAYKSRISTLESLICSYKQEIAELEKANDVVLVDGLAEFIKMMTNKKNKEIEEQRVRINNLSLSQQLLCQQIKEANAETRKWKADVTQLQSRSEQLQTEIEKLKLAKEETVLAKDSVSNNLQNDIQIQNDVTSDRKQKLSYIDFSRQIRRSKVDKENIEGDGTLKKAVHFSEDTQEPKVTSRKGPRGGKIIQVQSVLIPNIKKKLI